jgi:hypothetical protein
VNRSGFGGCRETESNESSCQPIWVEVKRKSLVCSVDAWRGQVSVGLSWPRFFLNIYRLEVSNNGMKQMAGILLFVLVVLLVVELFGCAVARGEDIDYEIDTDPESIFSTFQDKSVYSTDQDGNSAFTTFNGNNSYTTFSNGKSCITTCTQFGCYTTCF